jgi:hypothetical protein
MNSLIITTLTSCTISKTAQFTETDFSSLNSILLIVNYNHPHYGSVEFIKNLYKRAFPHIVFYGERRIRSKNVRVIPTNQGYYAQRVLADAIQNYPGYDGYLMLQDDCLLNFWNLLRFDKNKLWINTFGTEDLHTQTTSWWWNQMSARYQKTNAQATMDGIQALPDTFKEQITANIGKDMGAGGATDFIYIPQKYAHDYCSIWKHFNDIFVEIALPTIFLCMDDIQNLEITQSAWGSSELNNALDWIHPVKFSSKDNRDRVLREFVTLGALA